MVVENGDGLENSDSYVSVAFADDYFSARGISSWDGLEDLRKEQALVRATDYIDSIFQWYGQKLNPKQALRFPRQNLFDYEGQEVSGIPTVLKQSVCDAAILTSDGTELFITSEANGDVVSEKIGELAFTYQKNGGGSITSKTLYDSINTRLRGLYKDTGSKSVVSGKAVRA